MEKISSVIIFGDPGRKPPLSPLFPCPQRGKERGRIGTPEANVLPIENGTPVTNAAAKTTIFCHTGDNICEQGDIILLPHLVYATKAVQGATYAVKMAGL
jgi:hypothetical protein